MIKAYSIVDHTKNNVIFRHKYNVNVVSCIMQVRYKGRIEVYLHSMSFADMNKYLNIVIRDHLSKALFRV